ncbi:MAG: hypothetical protein IT292_08865 [Deltaproteobacteria bacterium]|nr:hypothetical protein [Deltaproteobacteria bacterium]
MKGFLKFMVSALVLSSFAITQNSWAGFGKGVAKIRVHTEKLTKVSGHYGLGK